jgi:hypothetical protein
MKPRILLISLALAVVIVSLGVGVVLSRGASSARADTTSQPVVSDQVPEVLPAQGVIVDGASRVLLIPPGDVDAALLRVPTVDEAIARVQAPLATDETPSSRAVLAIATVGATVPPPELADEEWNTIQDRLCWVVTMTYAHPIVAVIGGYVPDSSTSAIDDPAAYASHFNALVDAETGDSLWGFYSK